MSNEVIEEDKNEVKEVVKDYAFINHDDPENKKIFFVTRGYPKILEVEYPKPELDPKLFNVKENNLDQWEIHDDKVVATYEIIEKTLEGEKEKITKFFEHIYKVIKDGGISIEEGDKKIFVNTKEDNLELILEKLKDIKINEEIEWEGDPVEWETVNEKKLRLMKSRIIDHYERCDERLEELLGIVEVCQTIYGLSEIEYLEDWPNTIVVTYEDKRVRMFLMNELLDEERHLKYEKTTK
jgi:hypothetical protein